MVMLHDLFFSTTSRSVATALVSLSTVQNYKWLQETTGPTPPSLLNLQLSTSTFPILFYNREKRRF